MKKPNEKLVLTKAKFFIRLVSQAHTQPRREFAGPLPLRVIVMQLQSEECCVSGKSTTHHTKFDRLLMHPDFPPQSWRLQLLHHLAGKIVNNAYTIVLALSGATRGALGHAPLWF